MKKEIVIAGGCFWGVQEYYRRVKGVLQTEVGYAQGKIDHPSYEEVKTGDTQHAEVCYIVYDDNIIKLEKLLNLLFRIIDPTAFNHQGADYGTQYRSGIYYIKDGDKEIIEKFLEQQQQKYDKKLAVEYQKLKRFYPAEEYHQQYLVKNVHGYCHVDFHTLKKEEMKDEYQSLT